MLIHNIQAVKVREVFNILEFWKEKIKEDQFLKLKIELLCVVWVIKLIEKEMEKIIIEKEIRNKLIKYLQIIIGYTKKFMVDE